MAVLVVRPERAADRGTEDVTVYRQCQPVRFSFEQPQISATVSGV